MSTTKRPLIYFGKRRAPMKHEASGLIAAGLLYVVLTTAGIVMTAVA